MDFNTYANRAALITLFPGLANDANFKILSAIDINYNCIAWAMGYTDRWVDIVPAPWHWWPENVEKSKTGEALICAFEAEGFIRVNDLLPEPGFRKVILYKDAQKNEWTHASKLFQPGVEHSKFGQLWDGTHSADVLESSPLHLYGTPYAFMKKTAGLPPQHIAHGSMIVNEQELENLARLLS